MHEATYTPDWLARDMVALADVRGQSVLEPSAGRGALVQAAQVADADFITAIELNSDNFVELSKLARDDTFCFRRDFLLHKPDSLRSDGFDRVIMNPPLKDPTDHVLHAMKFVAPGGRLVALLHSHAAKAMTFAQGVREYRIADGTFMIEGREVDASIIVWDAPHE